jgi:hypothetical protein
MYFKKTGGSWLEVNPYTISCLKNKPDMVAHACNSSCLGSEGRRIFEASPGKHKAPSEKIH